MTREEFENLKVGDKVLHAFGGIGIVTNKEENGYTVSDPGFDCGDGQCEVSFAWNEGELLKKTMKASECKCIVCGAQAVAFYPVFDPDIPAYPYCRKCLDKTKAELIINILKIASDNEK